MCEGIVYVEDIFVSGYYYTGYFCYYVINKALNQSYTTCCNLPLHKQLVPYDVVKR